MSRQPIAPRHICGCCPAGIVTGGPTRTGAARPGCANAYGIASAIRGYTVAAWSASIHHLPAGPLVKRIRDYARHFDAQAPHGPRALKQRGMFDQELLAVFDFP